MRNLRRNILKIKTNKGAPILISFLLLFIFSCSKQEKMDEDLNQNKNSFMVVKGENGEMLPNDLKFNSEKNSLKFRIESNVIW